MSQPIDLPALPPYRLPVTSAPLVDEPRHADDAVQAGRAALVDAIRDRAADAAAPRTSHRAPRPARTAGEIRLQNLQDRGAALATSLAGVPAPPQARTDAALITQALDVMRGDQETMVVYADVLDTLNGYLAEISGLTSRLSKSIVPNKDGDKIELHTGEIRQAIENILKRQGEGGMPIDKAAYGKIRRELGNLVWYFARQDGSYAVVPNMQKLKKMQNDLPGRSADDKVTQSLAAHQAWMAGFNAQRDDIQTDAQLVMQKFAHRKAQFDNLIKILSGTIAAMEQIWKAYL